MYYLLTFFIMLKTNLIILLCLVASVVRAQDPQPGEVLLTNQTVISGVVDINSFINSAVVTTPDGRQLTYHASMIDQITVVDECDRMRHFVTYDYRSNSFFDRMEKKLFHVVEQGEITLLRRVFEYDVFDAEDEYEVEEWYYTTGGKIRRIKSFRRQVLPLMDTYAEEMKTFKKRNRLRRLNKEAAMYLMVAHYNVLSASDATSLALGE
jgi:hypothetical protein